MILIIVLLILILIYVARCNKSSEGYSDYLGTKIANMSNKGSYFYDMKEFQVNKTDLEQAVEDRDTQLFRDRQKFVQKKREIKGKGYNPISKKQYMNSIKQGMDFLPEKYKELGN